MLSCHGVALLSLHHHYHHYPLYPHGYQQQITTRVLWSDHQRDPISSSTSPPSTSSKPTHFPKSTHLLLSFTNFSIRIKSFKIANQVKEGFPPHIMQTLLSLWIVNNGTNETLMLIKSIPKFYNHICILTFNNSNQCLKCSH